VIYFWLVKCLIKQLDKPSKFDQMLDQQLDVHQMFDEQLMIGDICFVDQI